MKTQLIFDQSWQPSTVSPSTSVVHVSRFAMGAVCVRPSHLNAGMTTKKRHAAANTATVKGHRPWSPPVT